LEFSTPDGYQFNWSPNESITSWQVINKLNNRVDHQARTQYPANTRGYVSKADVPLLELFQSPKGNYVFFSVEPKRIYVSRRRRCNSNALYVCTSRGLPFAVLYPFSSAAFFDRRVSRALAPACPLPLSRRSFASRHISLVVLRWSKLSPCKCLSFRNTFCCFFFFLFCVFFLGPPSDLLSCASFSFSVGLSAS
jgi:hypothetical protein